MIEPPFYTASPGLAFGDEQADRFVTVHSPRPLAGEGLGVRVVDSTTDPLTLPLNKERWREAPGWFDVVIAPLKSNFYSYGNLKAPPPEKNY